MSWGVLRSHRQAAFITADLPWSILTVDLAKPTDFSFRDIFLPHVRTVVPLTFTTAVMLEAAASAPAPVRYGHVMREFNRTVNRTVAENAHRFVFSGSELLLRRLIKSTEIDRTERPVRFYGGTEEWLKPDASHITDIKRQGRSCQLRLARQSGRHRRSDGRNGIRSRGRHAHECIQDVDAEMVADQPF